MKDETPWAQEVYSKSPDFVHRDIAGELILVPIRSRLDQVNSLYVLNETGGAFWSRIDGSRTAREIVEDFSKEFDADPKQIEKDFRAFIEDLISIQAVGNRVPPRDG